MKKNKHSMVFGRGEEEWLVIMARRRVGGRGRGAGGRGGGILFLCP